jgi:hypothetical protein
MDYQASAQAVRSLPGRGANQALLARANRNYPNVRHPLGLGTDPNGILRRTQVATQTRNVQRMMLEMILRRGGQG